METSNVMIDFQIYVKLLETQQGLQQICSAYHNICNVGEELELM
jgi:hypothetical protein